MRTFYDIIKFLRQKYKNLLLLGLMLFLSACGDGECDTIQDYLNNGIGDNCLLCPLFKIISEAGEHSASISWSTFAADLRSVVAIAAAIYVAIYTLKQIGTFTKQNAADFFTGDKRGLFSLLFKAAVIILLLSSPFLCNEIIIPIMLAGLEIGSNLAIAGTNLASVSGASSTGFSGLFEVVNENIRNFNDQLYLNIAIANAMSCLSTDGWLLEWKFLMLLYSLLIFSFGWILLVGISFYMVDLLVRLSLAAILLPLGVAMAISEKTVSYTKNIWNIFINLFFSFIFLGIIIGLAANLIDLGLGNNGIGSDGMPDGAMNMFLSNLSQSIDENLVEQLSEDLKNNGSILLMVVCFSIIVKLASNIDGLVDKIAGGGGLPSPGQKVGAAIASHPAKKAKQLAGKLGKTGKQMAKYGGHSIARITRADKLFHWTGRKASTVRGFLTGTGSRGYNSMFRRNTWRQIGSSVAGLGRDIRGGDIKGGAKRVWGWIKK